jgi:DMSO/TMAO reductase YedYZ heme-binding membrane subunit
MTVILVTSLLFTLFALILYRPIHRYRYFIYGLTAVVAIIVGGEEANLVTLGYIPFGIFLVVMYTGILDKGKIKKRLLMVRAEFAVIASILIAPHAIGYLEYLLEDIGFFNANLPYYLGILAALIIAPLFVTSFQVIRRKMSYHQWKTLHKVAYIFYGIVALHLILIQNDRMVLYILLFGFYFVILGFNYSIKWVKNYRLKVAS